MYTDAQILRKYKAVKALGASDLKQLSKDIWNDLQPIALAIPTDPRYLDTSASKIVQHAKTLRRAMRGHEMTFQNIQPYRDREAQRYVKLAQGYFRSIPQTLASIVKERGEVTQRDSLAYQLFDDFNRLSYALEHIAKIQSRWKNLAFTNTDERYGGQEQVRIDDYRQLNPRGIFRSDNSGIYEKVRGRWIQIAE
jgi:hypothetical protein